MSGNTSNHETAEDIDRVTELYDAITDAVNTLEEAEDLLPDEGNPYAPEPVELAREAVEEVRGDLAESALDAYNDTEYAGGDD
jgi:hypothetical protein